MPSDDDHPCEMDNVQPLLSALDVFTRAPDKASLETANAWLQEFQHSVKHLAHSSDPTSDRPVPARRLVHLQPPPSLARCTPCRKALCRPDLQIKGGCHTASAPLRSPVPPGHLRSPSGRCSEPPPPAGYVDLRSPEISHRAPHGDHTTLLGTLWPGPTAPSVGQCSADHDRVVWHQSCNRPCASPVLDNSP